MREELKKIVEGLSLAQEKELLLFLAKEVFSVLEEKEKRAFVVEMVGQTGEDKVGSMVQL